jgi:hypothetical protein
VRDSDEATQIGKSKAPVTSRKQVKNADIPKAPEKLKPHSDPRIAALEAEFAEPGYEPNRRTLVKRVMEGASQEPTAGELRSNAPLTDRLVSTRKLLSKVQGKPVLETERIPTEEGRLLQNVRPVVPEPQSVARLSETVRPSDGSQDPGFLQRKLKRHSIGDVRFIATQIAKAAQLRKAAKSAVDTRRAGERAGAMKSAISFTPRKKDESLPSSQYQAGQYPVSERFPGKPEFMPDPLGPKQNDIGLSSSQEERDLEPKRVRVYNSSLDDLRSEISQSTRDQLARKKYLEELSKREGTGEPVSIDDIRANLDEPDDTETIDKDAKEASLAKYLRTSENKMGAGPDQLEKAKAFLEANQGDTGTHVREFNIAESADSSKRAFGGNKKPSETMFDMRRGRVSVRPDEGGGEGGNPEKLEDLTGDVGMGADTKNIADTNMPKSRGGEMWRAGSMRPDADLEREQSALLPDSYVAQALLRGTASKPSPSFSGEVAGPLTGPVRSRMAAQEAAKGMSQKKIEEKLKDVLLKLNVRKYGGDKKVKVAFGRGKPMPEDKPKAPVLSRRFSATEKMKELPEGFKGTNSEKARYLLPSRIRKTVKKKKKEEEGGGENG